MKDKKLSNAGEILQDLQEKEWVKDFKDFTIDFIKNPNYSIEEYENIIINKIREYGFIRIQGLTLVCLIRDYIEDLGLMDEKADSLIDGLWTGHTGDISYDYIIKYDNEPKGIELVNYLYFREWEKDISWKNK